MTRLKTSACILVLAAAVAGCNGTDAIDLSSAGAARVASQTPNPPAGQALPPPSATGGTTTTTLTDQSTVGAQTGETVAAIPRNARIQFTPVIGAAAETVQPLSNRLSARAGQRGLSLSTDGQGATYVVKGYFSTISDEKGTTIIYVWDVLDPAGNRLHRIQGQERATGRGEGWTAVTGANMDAVADRTIDEIAAWLQGAPART